jgi:hypothetical protein
MAVATYVNMAIAIKRISGWAPIQDALVARKDD